MNRLYYKVFYFQTTYIRMDSFKKDEEKEKDSTSPFKLRIYESSAKEFITQYNFIFQPANVIKNDSIKTLTIWLQTEASVSEQITALVKSCTPITNHDKIFLVSSESWATRLVRKYYNRVPLYTDEKYIDIIAIPSTNPFEEISLINTETNETNNIIKFDIIESISNSVNNFCCNHEKCTQSVSINGIFINQTPYNSSYSSNVDSETEHEAESTTNKTGIKNNKTKSTNDQKNFIIKQHRWLKVFYISNSSNEVITTFSPFKYGIKLAKQLSTKFVIGNISRSEYNLIKHYNTSYSDNYDMIKQDIDPYISSKKFILELQGALSIRSNKYTTIPQLTEYNSMLCPPLPQDESMDSQHAAVAFLANPSKKQANRNLSHYLNYHY